MNDLAKRFREEITGIVSVLFTGTWIAAMLYGFDWWLPFMLFGYIAVIPIISMLFEDDSDSEHHRESDHHTHSSSDTASRSGSASKEDALQTLRNRYASGELTEQQFERKLEQLLETENLENVEQRNRRSREQTDLETDLDTEFEIE